MKRLLPWQPFLIKTYFLLWKVKNLSKAVPYQSLIFYLQPFGKSIGGEGVQMTPLGKFVTVNSLVVLVLMDWIVCTNLLQIKYLDSKVRFNYQNLHLSR